MPDDADKLTKLLEFVQAEGRVCPRAEEWWVLWEMLPDKREVNGIWEPVKPYVRVSEYFSGVLEKVLFLRTQIQYAAEHGALDAVDAYLRGLTEDAWETVDNLSYGKRPRKGAPEHYGGIGTIDSYPDFIKDLIRLRSEGSTGETIDPSEEPDKKIT